MSISRYGYGRAGYGGYYRGSTYEPESFACGGFRMLVESKKCIIKETQSGKEYKSFSKEIPKRYISIYNMPPVADFKILVVFDEKDSQWKDYFTGEPVDEETSTEKIGEWTHNGYNVEKCSPKDLSDNPYFRLQVKVEEISMQQFAEEIQKYDEDEINAYVKRFYTMKNNAKKLKNEYLKIINSLKKERDEFDKKYSTEELQTSIEQNFGKFRRI